MGEKKDHEQTSFSSAVGIVWIQMKFGLSVQTAEDTIDVYRQMNRIIEN